MSAEDVDAFVAKAHHPLTAEIEALRTTILGADKSITEGIKWNAPSFRTTEWFATTHLRTKAGIGVILHLGAKTRATAKTGIDIADPTGLLQWLAKDRAMVTFADVKDIKAKQRAFRTLLKEWIAHV